MNKKRRFNKVLINPTEEEMFENDPLMAFSWYLSGRNNLLLSTLDEIIENLDKGFTVDRINQSGLIQKASSQMWFWTLGAYEVIRTISQAKVCFSDDFNVKVADLKRELGKVRIPNAKMEKKGKNIPVTSNRSPDGWDFENKDLLIGDPEHNFLSARNLLQQYDDVMGNIRCEDVLKHHEESYKNERS